MTANSPAPATPAERRLLAELHATSALARQVRATLADAAWLRAVREELEAGRRLDAVERGLDSAEQRSRMGGASADGGMTLYNQNHGRDGRFTTAGGGAIGEGEHDVLRGAPGGRGEHGGGMGRGDVHAQGGQGATSGEPTVHLDAAAEDNLAVMTGGMFTHDGEEGSPISAHEIGQTFGAGHGDVVNVSAQYASGEGIGDHPSAVGVEVLGAGERTGMQWALEPPAIMLGGGGAPEVRMEGAWHEPGHERDLLATFGRAVYELNNRGVETFTMPTSHDPEENALAKLLPGVHPGEEFDATSGSDHLGELRDALDAHGLQAVPVWGYRSGSGGLAEPRADGGMTLYSAGQPRDGHGRWTSTGDGGAEATTREGHTLRVEREAAGGGYHLTHRDEAGGIVREARNAPLAEINRHAAAHGVTEKLTAAPFAAAAKAAKAAEIESHVARVVHAHDIEEAEREARALGGAHANRALRGFLEAHTQVEVGRDAHGEYIRVTNHRGQSVLVRADAKFGGYRLVDGLGAEQGALFANGRLFGNRLSDHNAYLAGFAGLKGLLKEGMIEPGPKPDAARMRQLREEDRAAREDQVRAVREAQDRAHDQWREERLRAEARVRNATRPVPAPPLHRDLIDEPRVPDPEARTDEHGQHLPFSMREFDEARAGGTDHARGINETVLARIGDREYFVKAAGPAADGYGYSRYEQQRNEAATVAGMKALGMGDLAPREAYHVVGSDGRRYAVVSKEANDDPRPHEDEVAFRVPVPELRRAVLAEYLLGMSDRHVGNYLYHEESGADGRPVGHVKEIDFGFGLVKSIALRGGTAVAELWSTRVGGGDGMRWPRAEVGRILAREPAVMRALSRFDLSREETAALRGRFAALRQVYDATTGHIGYRPLGHAAGAADGAAEMARVQGGGG